MNTGMNIGEMVSAALVVGIFIMGIFQRMKAQERERNEKEKERFREEMKKESDKNRENDIVHFKTETTLLVDVAVLEERSKHALYNRDK